MSSVCTIPVFSLSRVFRPALDEASIDKDKKVALRLIARTPP
jgi:hypothetical protein